MHTKIAKNKTYILGDEIIEYPFHIPYVDFLEMDYKVNN